MEPSFWHDRWESNQIGFHEGQPNPLLVAHIDTLGLKPGARVFVPLCGKTADIPWLLDRGFRVAGAELSEIAVSQLFESLGHLPTITAADDTEHHAGDDIDIFVGDIFDLTAAQLGPVDAVYDRAALVAMPDAMRARYAAHLIALTDGAPQLLITYEYDQNALNGPPFSVGEDIVRGLYERVYQLDMIVGEAVAGGFKGGHPAVERLWRLRPRVS